MSKKEKQDLTVREAIEQLVLNLISARPEQRASEANKIHGYMGIMSMSGYVWDELCRSRKNKPLPGLTVITEMMDAQGKKHLRAGQDPALQILSLACIQKDWMQVIVNFKLKKVIQGVIAAMSDPHTTLRCKENAAWILRCLTESSDKAKVMFAGQRENLAVAADMLIGGSLSPSSPTIEVFQSSPDDENELCTSPTVLDGSSAEKSTATMQTFSSPERGGQMPSSTQNAVDDIQQTHKKLGGGDQTTSPRADLNQLSSPRAQQLNASARAQLNASPNSNLQSPEFGSKERALNNSFTGLANTGVAFAADTTTEQCTIEGNCCLALAASALKDEVLDRLGGTKEILTGLIHVLDTGSEWAAGNAARAIANIAYRPENLNSFMTLIDETSREKLISGLTQLAKDDSRPRSKEYSALCIANMLAHDGFLVAFNKVEGLKEDLTLLQNNADPSISTEATRAITIINQARFGTISWRAPKRV